MTIPTIRAAIDDDQAANRSASHQIRRFSNRHRGRYREDFRRHQIGHGTVLPRAESPCRRQGHDPTKADNRPARVTTR